MLRILTTKGYFNLYRSKFERYCVHYLNIMKNEQDHFEVLRKIQASPKASQREMAEELGFSLGKLNYCLKALQSKGLVKIENLSVPHLIPLMLVYHSLYLLHSKSSCM